MRLKFLFVDSYQIGISRTKNLVKAAIAIAVSASFSGNPVLAAGKDFSSSVFDAGWVTDAGTIQAGKAFAINLDGCPDPLLVTALHLFGPSGGLTKKIEAVDLKKKVLRIELQNITKRENIISFKAVSVTPDGALAGKMPMTGVGDFASFSAPKSMRRVALNVATSVPAVGERLLVVTSVIGLAGRLVFEAETHGFQDGYLMYKFITPGFSLQATSGAPVLNLSGQVVAINLRGGVTKDGVAFGGANPATAWASALKGTCGTRE